MFLVDFKIHVNLFSFTTDEALIIESEIPV